MIPAVYIHIPFCLNKCGYCAFYSVVYRPREVRRYCRLLLQELDLCMVLHEIKADTVYFGGGTPSLLSADQIMEILGSFDRCGTCEITLEINPVQINHKFLSELKRTPVNRLSIGIQSMQEAKLSFLGRKHGTVDLKQVMCLCRESGYDNISVDLMYGLPGENCQSLESDIERLLELEPQHISAYLLSLEPGTLMASSSLQMPSDEESAAQYHLIRRKLREAGFVQYEISNFAREGHESRHNLHYWEGDEYLGTGASASGCIQGIRYVNPSDLGLYETQIKKGLIMPSAEYPEGNRQRIDYIIMAFRLCKGIDRQEYRRRFGTDIHDDYPHVLGKDELKEMFEIDALSVRLSDKALFVSNSVLGEFV